MQHRFIQLSLLGFALIAFANAAFAEPGKAMEACRDWRYERASYVLCTFDPSADDMRLFWRNANGAPYRTFSALRKTLEGEGRVLAFAMNGGMYERDFSPVGLHIEKGRTLAKANTKTVKGRPSQVPNFYKKPNGVFYWGGGAAAVQETGHFLAENPDADFATQSGPLLVMKGVIHPAFLVKSKDFKPRNGVGVTKDGKVHFLMTRGRVSFHEFARAFRNGLKTPNALFLDGGTAPGLFAPSLKRNDPPSHGGYGPIIAVVE